MITVVKDWQLVSIVDLDKKELIGQVLYATVVDDSTCRFYKDNYVTTSNIERFDMYTKLVETATGSTYQLLGTGQKAEVEFKYFELLRAGHSPQEIHDLVKLAH